MHQAITLIAVIVRVFSKLAMENSTHPFSRVQNVAHYSRAPDRRVERPVAARPQCQLPHRSMETRMARDEAVTGPGHNGWSLNRACLAFRNDRRRSFALAVVLRTASDAEEG